MAISRVSRNALLADDTAASAKVWAETVAAKLEELLRPHLEEGEAMPDMRLFQKLLGRLLADREKQLRESDRRHHVHDVSAVTLRSRRDEATRALRGELRNARHFLEQTRGKGEGARQGIGEGLSYMAPHFLVSTGHHIAFLLDVCEKDGLGSATLASPSALSKAIRTRTEALEQALDELRPERIHESVSRHEKRENVEKTEKTVRRTAAVLAELYKLCDCDYFAKNVRPVFRRRRRKGSAESQTPVEQEAAASPLPIDEEIVRLPTDRS